MPSSAIYIAIVGLAVVIGLASGFPAVLSAIAALGIGLTIGLTGKKALLGYAVLTSAVGYGVLSGLDAGPLGSLGGGRIEAVRILIALIAFVVILIEDPAILAGLRYVWMYGLFLGLACISIIWSPDRLLGLLLLCKLLYPVGVFLVALSVTRRSGPLFLMNVVAAAVVLGVLLDLGVWAAGISPYVGPGYEGRLHGASHPNAIGHFGVVSSLIMYAAWRIYRRARYALLGLAGLGEAVWSGSRTALVAGLVGFLLFEVIERRPRRALLVAGIGLAVWLAVPTLGARTSNSEITVDLQAGNEEVNLSGRLSLWREAWDAFSGSAAFVGHGLGATEHFFSNIYVSLRSVHNGYLFLLFDVGILGAVSACLFFLVIGADLATGANRSVPFAALSLSLLAVFLVSNVAESAFTGFAFQSTAVWACLGLAAVGRMPGTMQEPLT